MFSAPLRIENRNTINAHTTTFVLTSESGHVLGALANLLRAALQFVQGVLRVPREGAGPLPSRVGLHESEVHLAEGAKRTPFKASCSRQFGEFGALLSMWLAEE